MRTSHNPIYRLLVPHCNESLDLYRPRLSDFHDFVSSRLPECWELKRQGICFHCSAPQNVLPEHGWKIHISSTRAHAQELLIVVGSILFAAGDTGFKFALDLPTLSLLNGKNWPRGGSGKFITIYPPNNARFLELIEELHLATREFKGPYILSDHRYKDSHVVFYRYGGMKLRESIEVTGERTPMLAGPDGKQIPDQRLAYPTTPPWAAAVVPIEEQRASGDESHSLHGGRFEIEGVLNFSNAGGVYYGRDKESGARVVIKEARPHVEVSDGNDAIALLKKEYRLLTQLADTDIVPQPVDLFEELGHWFLVEEYVEGVSLGAHSASHNILLRTRPSKEDFAIWYSDFRQHALKLIEIVHLLHSRNIVFSDLSPSNLIVSKGSNSLKIIDFEGAYDRSVDPPTSLHTPGFVSPRRLEGAAASAEDDYYSAGAVLMAYLMPWNGFFHLKPGAKDEFMALIQVDAHLSESVSKMILGLMEPDPARRPDPASLAEMLPESGTEGAPKAPKQEPAVDYTSVLEGIMRHMLDVASYQRRDSLFPADPKLFTTNPLSLAYGATGIAYAMKQVTGFVPRPVIDWILAHSIHRETYAPGLYLGMSGIAWGLLEIGETAEAERLFQHTFGHPLLDRSFDLFYGEAGWGMTSLRFFLKTGNELYLQKALECGSRLMAGQWRKQEANRPLGMAHGASGIALYLLYLYLATKDEDFLNAGREALDSDLSTAVNTKDGGWSWGRTANTQSTLYPYWRHGSAGVGAAVVRYHKVLGDDTYGQALEKIFIDTDREYVALPGRFAGQTGLGDFLLDAWEFTGEEKYFESANKVARAVLKFSVNRNGIAFPGDSLNRLCCDYGSGSAGIALFLNRLAGRQKADFLLDDLLNVGKAMSGGCFAYSAQALVDGVV